MEEDRLRAHLAAEDEDEKGTEALMKRLLKARVILVGGMVTDRMARRITAQALVLRSDGATEPATVYVNSPGGSADAGFAIFDILRHVGYPVRTVVHGLCASAAVLIALAAPQQHRFALPHARFLLHQPSSSFYGSASDIAINAEEIVRLKRRYNAIVAEETGRDAEQITRDADRDFWLSATQALEYGLVGRIVRTVGELG